MSRMYGRDKVRVTPTTKSHGLGELTRGTYFDVKCMVEDVTKTENSSEGRPAGSSIYIFMPPVADIKRTYYVQVIERYGVIVSEEEKIIIQATRYGGIKQTHWEVYA